MIDESRWGDNAGHPILGAADYQLVHHASNGRNANSGIVVAITSDDYPGGPLAGVDFQRELESRAFVLGGSNYKAPLQREFAIEAILEALPAFAKQIPGFDHLDAVLTGVETCTCSSLRITRGADLQSTNTPGLFPAGEGAGFAGGILSAGIDGLRVGEAVARHLSGLLQIEQQQAQ